MEEEFIEEDAPFTEGEGEEAALEDDELEASEEGFIKGFEDRTNKDAKKQPVDEDEQLTD